MAEPATHKDGRRKLTFNTLDDILGEARSFAGRELATRGNWTAAENIDHVALGIEGSVHGFKPAKVGLPMKLVVRTIVKIAPSMFLDKPFNPGIKLPPGALDALSPRAGVSLDDAMQRLEQAIADAKTQGMHDVSPIAGKLTDDQWRRLHCRHAELHFSMIDPQPAEQTSEAKPQAAASGV